MSRTKARPASRKFKPSKRKKARRLSPTDPISLVDKLANRGRLAKSRSLSKRREDKSQLSRKGNTYESISKKSGKKSTKKSRKPIKTIKNNCSGNKKSRKRNKGILRKAQKRAKSSKTKRNLRSTRISLRKLKKSKVTRPLSNRKRRFKFSRQVGDIQKKPYFINVERFERDFRAPLLLDWDLDPKGYRSFLDLVEKEFKDAKSKSTSVCTFYVLIMPIDDETGMQRPNYTVAGAAPFESIRSTLDLRLKQELKKYKTDNYVLRVTFYTQSEGFTKKYAKKRREVLKAKKRQGKKSKGRGRGH